MGEFTHLDHKGEPKMVDVSGKPISRREAVAEGYIRLSQSTLEAIKDNTVPKGNVLTVARIAGIQAAKQTHILIPLCHPLPLTKVDVDAQLGPEGVRVEARVVCASQTGVEMEALTAVSVALLTVYDMCKALDKFMEIYGTRLLSKTKVPAGEGGGS